MLDRPRQGTTKVTDFRKYHLLGDLDKEVEGIVDSRVNQFEMATVDEIKQQLQLKRDQSKKLQEDAEIMEMRNEMELEKMKQQQWTTAIEKMKEAREQASQEHEKCMEKINQIVSTAKENATGGSLRWL